MVSLKILTLLFIITIGISMIISPKKESFSGKIVYGKDHEQHSFGELAYGNRLRLKSYALKNGKILDKVECNGDIKIKNNEFIFSNNVLESNQCFELYNIIFMSNNCMIIKNSDELIKQEFLLCKS